MSTNHRIYRTTRPRFDMLRVALSKINGPMVAALLINAFIWGVLLALWLAAQGPRP
jgi:hypothetical protein